MKKMNEGIGGAIEQDFGSSIEMDYGYDLRPKGDVRPWVKWPDNDG